MNARFLILHSSSGIGLSRDAEVLERALRRACAALGAECEVAVLGDLPLSGGHPRRQEDLRRMSQAASPWALVFHLEDAFYLPLLADRRRFREHVLIPNPEVLSDQTEHNARLLGIERVLCKTRFTADLIRRDFKSWRPIFTGWDSIDIFEQDRLKRWDLFLHVRGESTMKQSRAVIDCWLAHPEFPPLIMTLIPHGYEDVREAARGLPLPCEFKVRDNFSSLLGELPVGELRKLMNTAGVHLCPSLAEGFGHYINEARSTGACVVTTDAPPMNELVGMGGVLIPVDHQEPAGRGLPRRGTSEHCHSVVTPAAIAGSVRGLLRQPEDVRREMGRVNRESFLREGARFVKQLSEFLAERKA